MLSHSGQMCMFFALLAANCACVIFTHSKADLFGSLSLFGVAFLL
jgi:hypothetical protein